MAGQPEGFVRELEPAEAQRLVKITRTAKDRVRLRRAGIVLASTQGRSASEAAGMFAASAQYAREVIRAFNEQGFPALDPKCRGGRPAQFGPAARAIICQTAKTPPQRLDLPFTTWSLSKLAAYLAQAKRIVISTETVRGILRQAGIRWQAAKTWKASRDPEFTVKMARILNLYDQPPTDGRVLCVDEFAPAEPATSTRPGLVPLRVSGTAAGDLPPHRRHPAHARRPRFGQRTDVLPIPRPQTLARVPRLLQTTPRPIPDRQALPDLRQL